MTTKKFRAVLEILKGVVRKAISIDNAVKEVVERFDKIYEMVKEKKSRR